MVSRYYHAIASFYLLQHYHASAVPRADIFIFGLYASPLAAFCCLAIRRIPTVDIITSVFEAAKGRGLPTTHHPIHITT